MTVTIFNHGAIQLMYGAGLLEVAASAFVDVAGQDVSLAWLDLFNRQAAWAEDTDEF